MKFGENTLTLYPFYLKIERGRYKFFSKIAGGVAHNSNNFIMIQNLVKNIASKWVGLDKYTEPFSVHAMMLMDIQLFDRLTLSVLLNTYFNVGVVAWTTDRMYKLAKLFRVLLSVDPEDYNVDIRRMDTNLCVVYNTLKPYIKKKVIDVNIDISNAVNKILDVINKMKIGVMSQVGIMELERLVASAYKKKQISYEAKRYLTGLSMYTDMYKFALDEIMRNKKSIFETYLARHGTKITVEESYDDVSEI